MKIFPPSLLVAVVCIHAKYFCLYMLILFCEVLNHLYNVYLKYVISQVKVGRRKQEVRREEREERKAYHHLRITTTNHIECQMSIKIMKKI